MCYRHAIRQPAPAQSCTISDLSGAGNFLANNENTQQETDLSDNSANGLEFERHYSSHLAQELTTNGAYYNRYFQRKYEGNMGLGWTHNHQVHLSTNITPNSDDVKFDQARIQMPGGVVHYFNTGRGASVNQYASRTPNLQLQLLNTRDSTQSALAKGYAALTKQTYVGELWTLTDTHTGTVHHFDNDGKLTRRVERNGWQTTYTYDGNKRLTSVQNNFGKRLVFEYSGVNITRVTTADGRSVSFEYSGDKLVAATPPGSAKRRYVYDSTQAPALLSGIVDETGTHHSNFAYDAEGFLVQTSQAGGVNSFQSLNRSGSLGSTTQQIKTPLGQTVTYSRHLWADKAILTGGPAPLNPSDYPRISTYVEPSGVITQITDQYYRRTSFTWDLTRRLPLTVTEAAGWPEQRTTTTEWHPQWRLPLKVTETGRVTTYTYDAAGNPLSQTVLDTSNNQSRTTRWAYNAQGLVASETAPNGAITTYTYDASGNLTQSVNPLGHTHTYSHDGAGRITRHTSPTGLVTTYTYDSRGRVLAATATTPAGVAQTTTFTYTPAGQLATARLASGHQITYTYDAAQRQTGWSDNRGASATYQLDAMGNRVREEISTTTGPNPGVVWLLTRSINTINRVASTTAGGYLTTTYSYDANGDLIRATNGKNESTSATLDPLRRVKAITNAQSATATLTLNTQDDTTAAKDYKGVTTEYQRDTLGNAKLEASTDSGNQTAQYDALGLPSQTINALGKATTIARDALGRPTTITHPDASKTTLAYDLAGDTYNAPGQPSASKGMVSLITDTSGTTTYQRDAFGRVTRKTQRLTVPGSTTTLATQTTTTSYTAAGQTATITYPSGGQLAHSYNATGQLTALTWNGQPLLTGITYNPLGQPTSWTWQYADANAATATNATRRYTTAGQLAQTELGQYTYDPAGRVTAITYSLMAPASANPQEQTTAAINVPWTVQYDTLGRITQFATIGANVGTHNAYPAHSTTYTYDANGNRRASTTKLGAGTTLRTTTQTHTLATTHNQLLATTTQTQIGTQAATTTTATHSYNTAGDTTTDGQRSYTYNSQQRLAIASTTPTTANPNPAKTNYLYNALGQRVFKTDPIFGTPTADNQKLGWAYLYDETGTLLGEYGMGGAASSGSTEHIYLPTAAGPLPVATIINGQHYAVHTDHLNTPRRLTAANNQAVWQWAYSAFGQEQATTAAKRFTSANTVPNTGTTTTQPVAYHQRYPGQSYDVESGLHYNYFRTYDPQTGRYTQPDPIGLEGGWNRYSYVSGNPLGAVDPFGLAEFGQMIPQPNRSVGGPQFSYNPNDVRGGFDTDGRSLVYNPRYYDPDAASRLLLTAAMLIAPEFIAAGRAAGAVCTASGVAADAKFAQKTYGAMFSAEGMFTGRSVDDVAAALRSGAMKPGDVPVNYIVRDGQTIMLNTRSAQALEAAGIPRSQWNGVNQTGNQFLENLLNGQLSRNPGGPFDTVRRAGKP